MSASRFFTHGLFCACITMLSSCSWYKDYVAKNELNQICTKALDFAWEDYKSKEHKEARADFEHQVFKDDPSNLIKRIWEESFAQAVDKRYSYFTSQLKSFEANADRCLVLEKLFEEKVPEDHFSGGSYRGN